MTISSWLGLHRSILDGSLMEEPLATRWLWVVLLLVAGKGGFVGHTIERLARRAELTLEETKTGMKCFESPDPKSRSTTYDGKRIEKVEGGWRILNYQAHLDGLKSREAMEDWITSNGTNGHTNPNSPSPTATATESLSFKEKKIKGYSRGDKCPLSGDKVSTNSPPLSLSEKRKFEALSTDLKRNAFLLFRRRAEKAASLEEADFKIPTRGSARALGCNKSYISAIIEEFLSSGILRQTGNPIQFETSAKYRWAIETTLPIPAYAGMDIENDDPF
jgi:hypothetical protein